MEEKTTKYYSIYKDLKKDIIENIYPVGTLVPAEPQLQVKYRTSRVTIRKAVQLLVDEGYLERIHGIGTIVLSKKETLQLQTLISFSQETGRSSSQSQLLFFNNEYKSSPVVATKLNIPNGTLVTIHEKVRYSNNIPIGFQKVYTPNFIQLSIDELSPIDVSLYNLFKVKGHEVASADETIESILSNKKISKILQISENSPLLYVQRVTKDQSGLIIEYAEIFCRGDRYRYNIHLDVDKEN